MAGKWDELTRRQLFAIINRFAPNTTIAEFKLKVMLALLEIQVKRRKPVFVGDEVLFPMQTKGRTPFLATADQLAALADSLQWLLTKTKTKEDTEIHTLNSQLTTNLIPAFSHRLVKYYGPDSRLFNLVFEEFLEADSHYSNYLKSGNPADLDKLVATLYRRKGTDSSPADMRATFNAHMVEANAKKIHYVDRTVKLGIFLFFQGCRNFLTINFPHVFSTKKGTASRGGDYGPLSLIDALTGDDVTKNKQVRTSMMYDVMVRLERASVAADEIKEKLKSRKP